MTQPQAVFRASLPPASIFREYDIRGVVGETLSPETARQIGRAFAEYVFGQSNTKNKSIAVGYDGRLSSPAMEAALTQGLMEAGAEVVRIGLGPTPMLYYAAVTLHTAGAVMVTGSHNPPTHNGFKMMAGKRALYGAEIKALHEAIARGFSPARAGSSRKQAVFEDYVACLLQAFRPGGRELAVAWDSGNGAGGEVMAALAKRLPGRHVLLNAKIDGTFPAHHPDPSEAKNLQQLIETVRRERCSLGIAFDGDADRIGAVDGEGNILWGDQLLAILARDVLARSPGATVIADVKASQGLFDEIARLGGTPLMWKTGHSLIKAKMAETGAKLAGEMSGHMFFADEYYGFDDGIYAAVRLLSFLASQPKSLAELLAALPQAFASPEYRLHCDDARKFQVIEEVAARLAKTGAEVSSIDGVRVKTQEGWWLLRASNTGEHLVARCEGKSANALETLKSALAGQLAASCVAFGEE